MYNVRMIHLSWNLQASGIINTKLNYKNLVMFTSNTHTHVTAGWVLFQPTYVYTAPWVYIILCKHKTHLTKLGGHNTPYGTVLHG